MNNTIIIAPYAQKLRNGKYNPKNYPYWEEVVYGINKKGYHITQIGVEGEEKIKYVNDFKINLPFIELEKMSRECFTWFSVDSFFQHLAKCAGGKPGIVLYSVSDPTLWGYNTNLNLLKDKKYLRDFQFGIWEECEFNKDSYMNPKVVIASFDQWIKKI